MPEIIPTLNNPENPKLLDYEGLWEEWTKLEAPQLPSRDHESDFIPESSKLFVVVDTEGLPFPPPGSNVRMHEGLPVRDIPMILVNLRARRTSEFDDDLELHYTKGTQYLASVYRGSFDDQTLVRELWESEFENCTDPFHAQTSTYLPFEQVARNIKKKIVAKSTPESVEEPPSSSQTPVSIPESQSESAKPTTSLKERLAQEGQATTIEYLSLIRMLTTGNVDTHDNKDLILKFRQEFIRTEGRIMRELSLSIIDALNDPENSFAKPVKLRSDLVLYVYTAAARGENLTGPITDLTNQLETLLIRLYQTQQETVEDQLVTKWEGKHLVMGAVIAKLVRSIQAGRADPALIQALQNRKIGQVRFEVGSHRITAGEARMIPAPIAGAFVAEIPASK